MAAESTPVDAQPTNEDAPVQVIESHRVRFRNDITEEKVAAHLQEHVYAGETISDVEVHEWNEGESFHVVKGEAPVPQKGGIRYNRNSVQVNVKFVLGSSSE